MNEILFEAVVSLEFFFLAITLDFGSIIKICLNQATIPTPFENISISNLSKGSSNTNYSTISLLIWIVLNLYCWVEIMLDNNFCLFWIGPDFSAIMMLCITWTVLKFDYNNKIGSNVNCASRLWILHWCIGTWIHRYFLFTSTLLWPSLPLVIGNYPLSTSTFGQSCVAIGIKDLHWAIFHVFYHGPLSSDDTVNFLVLITG